MERCSNNLNSALGAKMNDTEYIRKFQSIFDLTGRVAIVTGAAGGLGRIITLSLVAFGAHVVLASRNIEELKQLQREIQEFGGLALAVATDITQEDQVDKMVAKTLERFEKIDILINNAAILQRARAEEMSLESWQKVMETNVTGAFLCSQKVGKTMIPRKRGKIINISSVRGRFGRPEYYTSYCTSKGGLDSLTRALACEWGKYNINVNTIAPSLFEAGTAKTSLAEPDYRKKVVERIPLKRWGEIDDLIGSVVFLASDASNFVNGHILYVDGGYSVSA